jgi:hypothetical protein
MLKGKLIALTAALAFVVMALPAGAASVDIPGGQIVAAPSDTIILPNTWNLGNGEMADVWAWSIQCTGCSVVAYNMNFAFGAPPAPPSTPGNVLWQAPSYSVIQGTLPGYVNNGSFAGSIGAANPGGAIPGNGLDVLVGWVTVHVSAASGGVTPFFTPQDGILAAGNPNTVTFSGVTWAPEPGTAMLLALGMGGLGIMGRRNR